MSKIKPEEFSPMQMYGNKDIFQKMLNEGYTEVALGGGDWVDDYRIVGIFAFFHPNGKIHTFETPKYDDGGHTMRGTQFEANYTMKGFEKYKENHKIEMETEKQYLKEIVDMWK